MTMTVQVVTHFNKLIKIIFSQYININLAHYTFNGIYLAAVAFL